MSLWDKYFAPGDLRRQRQRQKLPTPTAVPDAPPDALGPLSAHYELPKRIDAANRARRQNALLFGGIGFTFLSILFTRRAVRRKLLPDPTIEIFTPSNTPPPPVISGMEALEALGLATLNVFSVAMASAGGLMKFFDVADLEDFRKTFRRRVAPDAYEGGSAADKELEGWLAGVPERKLEQGELREGPAKMLAEHVENNKTGTNDRNYSMPKR